MAVPWLDESSAIDLDDSAALADAAARAQQLIPETPFPDELRAEVLESYREVGDGGAIIK
ncbi:hypothetical protein [Natrinema sp. 74]|uniref:hypothetical protein n=1 Tax=Natrinema sp. 74 TaxID=3384159 RepID=UPI0038D45DD6